MIKRVTFLGLFVCAVAFAADNGHFRNQERTIPRPHFMRDARWTNTNAEILKSSDNGALYDYRAPIVNASYNLEKAKILSQTIGENSAIDALNVKAKSVENDNAAFLLRDKIVKIQENYNRILLMEAKRKLTK